jgi:hypothetical protein
MEEDANVQASKTLKRDIGLWVGIMAIVINIITVSVYMYQAHIMQTQQHASAWPYLEWLPSFNEDTYYVEISNNGIGPAIIKNVDIHLDDKYFPHIDSLFIELIGTDYFPHYKSTVENRVLPAGKSIRLFQVNSAKWAQQVFDKMRKHEFKLSICYESIYGDAWTSEGREVTESKCKKINNGRE